MPQLTIDFNRFPDISNNKNLPSYAHPYYLEIITILDQLNDIYTGITNWYKNDQVIDQLKAVRYLPPNPAEEGDIYLNRLRRSRFKRVFRDAIKKDYSGLLSKIEFTKVPLSFEQSINNIDLMGNDAKTFFKQCDEFALRDGSCFILVEYPKTNSELSLAEKLKNRPYLIVIERKNLINWNIEYINGVMRFSTAVIVEKQWRDDGLFGKKLITRYRVLRIGSYQVFEIIQKENNNKQSSELILVEEGQTNLDFIPLVGYSLTSINTLESDFPLQDLADLNLEWYQLHSEKREMIHNCVPTLQINEKDESQTNSSNQKRAIVGHHSILWNVTAEWIEPKGTGITPTQLEEDKLNNEINEATLGFLSGNFAPRTATEVELDASQAIANLEGLGTLKENCINTILKYWSIYDGTELKDGVVKVDTELLKPAQSWTVNDVLNALAQGLISQQFGLLILQKNGMLDQFTDEQIQNEATVNQLSIPGVNQQVLG